MNRPGRGCFTCKLAECTGCVSVQCTAEESAMLRCAQLANQPRKKSPKRRQTVTGDMKDLQRQYNTEYGGFTT